MRTSLPEIRPQNPASGPISRSGCRFGAAEQVDQAFPRLKLDIEKELATWEGKLALVKSKGGKKSRVSQKFKTVGFQDEYETVYRSLCETTQSSFAGMIEHSFCFGRATKDFEITLYRAPNPETTELILDTAINLLNSSVQICAEILSNINHPSSAPK